MKIREYLCMQCETFLFKLAYSSLKPSKTADAITGLCGGKTNRINRGKIHFRTTVQILKKKHFVWRQKYSDLLYKI